MATFYIVEQNALSVGGHYYNYTSTIAKAATKSGFDVTILCNRRFNGVWEADKVRAVPAFKLTWADAERDWGSQSEWRPDNIAYDFASATRGYGLTNDDHVLFHTVSFSELFALLRYFGDLPIRPDHPYFHLALRYDPAPLEHAIDAFVPLFEKIKRSKMLRDRVLFYADTEQLSARFADLSGLEFKTVPIPFDQEHLRVLMAAQSKRPSAASVQGKPLTVAYLGDARGEKGYAALPDAVRLLWEKYVRPGHVKFVIQSNFNIAGGEPGIKPAFDVLREYPSDKVTLITEAPPQNEYIEHIWDADIIVIPYDPSRYKLRSSGILIEAMAAGKPVITTANSWMASQVRADHAIVIDNQQSLGPALKEMIDRFPEFSRAAKARAPDVLERATGESFVREIIARANDINPPRDAPRVLFVMDGDAVVLRNGASRVARTQLKYLQTAGYRVIGLFHIGKNYSSPAELEAYIRLLHQEIYEYEFEQVFVGAPAQLSTDTRYQQSIRERFEFSIKYQIENMAHYEFSTDFFRYLQQHKIDAVFLNYVPCFALLDSLGLDGIPVICEIHDIQSYQASIYRGTPITDDDLADEFRLLQRARYLISLNESETTLIRGKIPNVPIGTTGVFPSLTGVSIAMIAGCLDLAEVVSSSGPARREYDIEHAWRDNNYANIERLINSKGIDLLYVSSNHLANASGLRWFFDKVYVPHLATLGLTMVVAGSICDLDWPELDGVHFVGKVNDLSPLYAGSKIVVLPITEGAGSPIKTFEALGFGCATVATSIAARTLEKSNGTIIADTPADFARSVTLLLKSEPDRARLAQNALRLGIKLCDTRRYASIMNEAFSTVLGHRSLPIADLATTQPELKYVEWNAMVQSANRLVRCWIEYAPFHFENDSLKTLARLPPASVRETLRGILQALLVDKTAPILKTKVSLLKQIISFPERTPEAGLDLIEVALEAFRKGYSAKAVLAKAQEIADRSAGDPAAHYFLAYALHAAAQRPDAALVHYQKALELGFDKFWVLLDRLYLLQSLGRLDEMDQDIVRLEQLRSGMSAEKERILLDNCLISFSTAFNEGSYEVALLWGQCAIRVCPDQASGHFMVAESLRQLNRNPEAVLLHYAKALELGFDRRRVFTARSELLCKMERGSEARAESKLVDPSDTAGLGRPIGIGKALRTNLSGILSQTYRASSQQSTIQQLRQSSLFDSAFYLKANPDVAHKGLDPIRHYVKHGADEGRNPSPLFWTRWYLQTYPGARASKVNPLFYYLTQGWVKGHDPNPYFQGRWYLEQNPDVARAGVNPLQHYIRYGAAEGRDPNPFFDTKWYLNENALAAGEVNPLAHYLMEGFRQNANSV